MHVPNLMLCVSRVFSYSNYQQLQATYQGSLLGGKY